MDEDKAMYGKEEKNIVTGSETEKEVQHKAT